ncbi:hypothetical protein [Actinacidiphila glaucinigra]|uniref:hypothetical protein n=1 Tax=Actinacidiphila glaucinigra TaxID=235986 RepID=UPI003D8B34B4
MSVFAEAVRERIRRARARLEAALEAEDAYGADLAREELDDALRLAAEHSISTKPPEDEVSER